MSLPAELELPLTAKPDVDRQAEPFAFELRYSGLAPVWDASGHVQGQAWSNVHFEQPCRVAGWVESVGGREPFDGSGIRDHSRGSRDFSGMGPHWWVLGQFPSGRAFGLQQIDAPAMSNFLAVDGVLVEAEVVSLPADKALGEPFEIVLRGAGGTGSEERIRGELLHDAPITVRYPNEFMFGRVLGAPAHFDREGQIRWTWDGEVGDGLCERTITVDAQGDEERR